MDPTQINQALEVLAAAIAIIGVIPYYFGRIVADSKVEEFDKLASQIEGLFFVLFYIALPLVFIFTLYEKGIASSWINPYLGSFIVFLVVAFIFNVKLSQRIRHLKNIDENNTIVETILTSRVTLMTLAFFVLVPPSVVVIRIILLSTVESPILIFTSLLFSLFSLSQIAIMYGLATIKLYRSVIILSDDRTLSGKIIKFEKDFINVIDSKNNKHFFIAKNQIKYIEQEFIVTNSDNTTNAQSEKTTTKKPAKSLNNVFPRK